MGLLHEIMELRMLHRELNRGADPTKVIIPFTRKSELKAALRERLYDDGFLDYEVPERITRLMNMDVEFGVFYLAVE